MRIYGGHDYYDCALSLGIDPAITFIRGKSRSIPVRDAGGSLLRRKLEFTPRNMPRALGFDNIAVVFCDKVYRGMLASRGLLKPEGIWSADKARAWAAEEKNTTVQVETHWNDRQKMTLEQYFAPFPVSNGLRDYMIANRIAILVERIDRFRSRQDEPAFEVNPFTLRQLGFAKALDPYTAFQELSMWIGGVLGGVSPEIVPITDDRVLIENHGFDNRFSFRGPRIA